MPEWPMNAELPGLPFFCGYSRSPRLSAQNRYFAVGLVLARDPGRDDKLQRLIGANVQIFHARFGHQEGEPGPLHALQDVDRHVVLEPEARPAPRR